MSPHWRLRVKDLGKIASADIALRRLTLFVGPNNSGKSYLASLLWGIVALQFDLEVAPGPELDEVDAWLAAAVPSDRADGEVTISEAALSRLSRLFATTLRANADALARRVFNNEQMRVSDLAFSDESGAGPTKLSWFGFADRTTIIIDDGLEPGQPLNTDVGTSTRLVEIRDILLRRVVYRRLFRLFAGFKDSYSSIDPVYLPASRTGFMQLYKAPARLSMRGSFRGAVEEKIELTTPAYHFLDMIAFGIKPALRSKYSEEADFLEAGMGGRFELVPGALLHEYRYRPDGSDIALPMQLCSSLVTELGPLVLVLRHARSMPLLVLEEPEAHLHPALQRRLAQVVVRLVRKGLCVWITTHSENFCQQINNFIKLGSLPVERRAEAQRRLKYEPQDYLAADDVTAHELCVSNNRSTLVELKRTAAGLVMPTFNRELSNLGEEAIYLDDQLSDEDGQ